jgi:GDP-L-fucose synthase
MHKKIFIAGHSGMVGSSILRKINNEKFKIITATRKELDLTDKKKVYIWFKKNKPDIVINAAGKVGGIISNSKDSINYLNENLNIGLNIINAAYKFKVKKLINIGSSCIYPKYSKQPIIEEYLLTGSLEETNKCYAVAKIATALLCSEYNKKFKKDFITVMPCNLYGPNDNYDKSKSHVLAALMQKMHTAKIKKNKSIIIFGNGAPLREFLYVDDLATAIILLIKKKIKYSIINVGSGEEISIINLAKLISKILNYKVNFIFDKKKPNGTPRKILNSKKMLSLGWKPQYKLKNGIKESYEYFKNSFKK